MTRFFLPIGSPLLATPRARIFIAARTVSNCCFAGSACFCNFVSSCLNAAKMSMNPPTRILSRRRPRVKLSSRRICSLSSYVNRPHSHRPHRKTYDEDKTHPLHSTPTLHSENHVLLL